MEITCFACDSGTGSDGNPCVLCGGDGVVDLADADFANTGNPWQIHGLVWDTILTNLDTIAGYLTGGVKTRLTRIETKIDAIQTKLDES